MSTSYYRLAEPFSSIRLEEGAVHDHIWFYEEGAYAGMVTVRHGRGRDLVKRFIEDRDNPVMGTHWGGEQGAIVTINTLEPPDDSMVLISEYGEVLTVAQVKARAGATRKDGFPTELFGYEK